ncbi:MAG: hypothetical protein MPJ78_07210 [Hyphomicrobiaceae bacterium]|nr:hypothetical protein [Hyphomicrobiaceae bacterium]
MLHLKSGSPSALRKDRPASLTDVARRPEHNAPEPFRQRCEAAHARTSFPPAMQKREKLIATSGSGKVGVLQEACIIPGNTDNVFA